MDTQLAIITDRGIEELQDILKSRRKGYYVSEAAINTLGSRLLNREMIEGAIEIFKINVGLYPASADVYDSLGEAYLKDGQKELAVKSYKKSLELNPNNTNATEMLKKLNQEIK